MTPYRPYRRPIPHNKAMEEIVRNSGTQFDPQVVKAFLEAEKRGRIYSSWEEPAPRPVASRAAAEVGEG